MRFSKYLSAALLALSVRAQEPAAKAKPDPDAMVRQAFGLAPAPDPEKVARGKGTFVANCAFCHGSSATGGEGGPDLVRSALVSHDTDGDQIGPVILNGRQAKGMPKFALTQAQISDIAAFLRSQKEAKTMRFNYKIQNIVTGNSAAGKTYFEAHCSGCHSSGGDLKGVATRYEPVALQSRFLYPKPDPYGLSAPGPPPKPSEVTVTMPDGKTLTGKLQHLDGFNVAFYDKDGVYHSLLLEQWPGLKVEEHDPLAGHIELLQQYTDADMHNVLAFLETLK
jgi:cytochrome c oxidase cbb3-type subunit 3